MIYLDMDGVLADFFGAWGKLHDLDGWPGLSQWTDQERQRSIAELSQDPYQVEKFFAELEPLAGGQRLLRFLNRHRVDFSILSAPLDHDSAAARASIRGKRRWLQSQGLNNHLAIFTSDKWQYARDQRGIPSLLIDDYGVNIRRWRAAGGVAIHHEDSQIQSTLNQLRRFLKLPPAS